MKGVWKYKGFVGFDKQGTAGEMLVDFLNAEKITEWKVISFNTELDIIEIAYLIECIV